MNKIYDILKKYKVYFIIFIIAILFEIFVCNYTSFRILFVENKNMEVDFIEVKNTSYFKSEPTKPPSNPEFKTFQKTLLLKNIDFDIYSIQINSSNATKKSYGTIEIVANEIPYTNDKININREIATKTSKISNNGTSVNLSIDSKMTNELYINLTLYGEDVDFESIILNKFNLGFNIIRLLIIYSIFILIYLVKTKRVYKIKYDKNNKKHNKLYFILVIITTFLIFMYCVFEHFCYPEKIIVNENDTRETMILQADALLHGSIPLLKNADSTITDLENPYDISARYYYNSDYIFDSAYYDGNFYQYFSILPVIFFILPLKLITGVYISTRIVNSFLFCILLVLISVLYKLLVDRYIKKVSLFNLILGYLTVVFGSNVLNYTRGLMYDIPVVFGIISLVSAILLLFNLQETKRMIYIKLIFAGIFTGFVVMSKPSLVGYYILIFYMLYIYLYSFKENKKELFKKFLTFFIPLGILGLIQMWFNYVRFDSIFEFGALYQLTVADMNVHTGVTLPILVKGIFKFLFTLPKIEIFKFPFINTYDNFYYNTGLNEYEYENCVAGILIIPIIWAIFLKRKVTNSTSSGKKLNKLTNVTIITSIVLLIIVTCFAGAAEAYSIDIKLMLVITSVLIFFKIIEGFEIKDKIGVKKYNYIFLVLCTISIFLVLPQSFSTEGSLLENMYMPINYILQDIFAFWL